MTIKRSAFAKLCGVSPAYLANYVKRGKVILTGKEVDISLPENAEFMATRSKESTPKKKTTEAASTPVLTQDQKDAIELQRKNSNRKTDAQLLKLEAEAKLKVMQAAKLSGEAIPLDMTMDVIQQFGQSYLTAFRDFCENFAMDMSHKSRWTNEQLADARGKIIDGMNVSMKNAQVIAKTDIEKLAESYKINKSTTR